MPQSWNSFKNRRKVNLSAWVKHLGITSYEGLTKYCLSLGVVPPPKEEYSSACSGKQVPALKPIEKSRSVAQ